jgi:hypothetical protein
LVVLPDRGRLFREQLLAPGCNERGFLSLQTATCSTVLVRAYPISI